MGRWRPPVAAGSPYITAAGFEALQEELTDLWDKRRKVVTALAAAAAEGDRSENAEYIYRKKELGGIDRRIRYLQKRLPKLKVVREFLQQEKIFFGAWVSLEDESGTESLYRIVGPDETDGRKGHISMDSPLARSLMKREIADEVQLTIASKTSVYVITGIRYETS